MATLPTLSQTIDDKYLSVWDDIPVKQKDNILLGTPLMAKLKTAGCIKSQTGGYNVTRSLKIAVGTTTPFAKGGTVPAGELNTGTRGSWPFRNTSYGIQRDATDDAANQGGMDYIKSQVQTKLVDAMNGINQDLEKFTFSVFDSTETGKLTPHSLNDLLPAFNNRNTGTYGGIARGTQQSPAFWNGIYRALSLNPEINLMDDMRGFWNDIFLNYEEPNFILCDRTLHEQYEAQAFEIGQLIKMSTGNQMFDLGFKGSYFKGAEMLWSPNVQATDMLMLNTDHLELVKDPGMWMARTEWKAAQDNLVRVLQILCRWTLFSDEPRRHGRMYSNAASTAGASGAD